MHAQTGYQFALKGYDHTIESEPTGFIAILHGQIVAERTGNRLVLRDGGYTTPSTARAINGAFSDSGLMSLRATFVSVLQGGPEIRIMDPRTGEAVLDGEMVITLD